ncbi:hypothetical protein [Rhizobium lentis]|uniref:hypothetical protein n=1 Tax=Rhizobium lentis TaxID=1138194 RepID=UPI001C83D088|nr:hypothetical protein [Rhizobium lentis]MBX5048873.1 type II restriction endonuclease subunit M [Rhizobium lentis]MBX5060212.1 type II restriction endonuclease subunit M [Rhizobium lentis]
MTIVIRALSSANKSLTISNCVQDFRDGKNSALLFEFDVQEFSSIPGIPLAYWLPKSLRQAFRLLPTFENGDRMARAGMQTSSDFRFVRTWWEPSMHTEGWPPFAKGGRYSPFYSDLALVVNWKESGSELKAYNGALYGGGHWSRNLRNVDLYGKPGFTYPRRLSKLSVSPLPKGAVISIRGSGIYCRERDLLATGGLLASSVFDHLAKSMLGRFLHPQFDNSVISCVPIPDRFPDNSGKMAAAMSQAISAGRRKFEVIETSHQFLLPLALVNRVEGRGALPSVEDLDSLQDEIDQLAFLAYGLSNEDKNWISETNAEQASGSLPEEEDEGQEEPDESTGIDVLAADDGEMICSWGTGVAFGRFDWRLATGERKAPHEPDPFDPLPAKSPGMLPNGATPFHDHNGILVDDRGHPHDLPRLIEEVLARVDAKVPGDVRRWLQRDFFPLHLKLYSQGGRKAPIYWPLSTISGSYTLWLYYPNLTTQTLYTAVNDFVEPKLKQVSRDSATLRDKGAARSHDDEKAFEALQSLELELVELRDTLLTVAPTYRPCQDDGVQITAAPLWQFFRHKPWQKIVRDTWAKLEKGEYDWAHLAMAYWPDRVREKCKTDKSLAIAHDLEELYVGPELEGGSKKKAAK